MHYRTANIGYIFCIPRLRVEVNLKKTHMDMPTYPQEKKLTDGQSEEN